MFKQLSYGFENKCCSCAPQEGSSFIPVACYDRTQMGLGRLLRVTLEIIKDVIFIFLSSPFCHLLSRARIQMFHPFFFNFFNQIFHKAECKNLPFFEKSANERHLIGENAPYTHEFSTVVTP